jgi:hypothetical protein
MHDRPYAQRALAHVALRRVFVRDARRCGRRDSAPVVAGQNLAGHSMKTLN